MLSGEGAIFVCADRLIARPHTVYKSIAGEKGLIYSVCANKVRIGGRLSPGEYNVAGDLSSQFISGLLFALSALDEDSRIIVTSRVESRPYIDMTLSAMANHGVRCFWENDSTLFIKGGQKYSPNDLTVEGDYSATCFAEALNLLGSEIRVDGLNPDSIQGDKVYKEIFPRLTHGCPTVDISDTPDLGPVLFALGAALNGVRIKGIKRLRLKESDRVMAMAEELEKLGATVEIYENEATVYPAELKRPALPLSGHNDHRIVMALSVLLTLTGGEITDAEAVEKSYPDFFKVLCALGFTVTECK
jgi:3-phosphoshikimate 1-carboxyvinyltransferase